MKQFFKAGALTVLLAVSSCSHDTPDTTPDLPVESPIGAIATPVSTAPVVSTLPTALTQVKAGNVPAGVVEASGMAYSRDTGRVYWINDSGGTNQVFVSDKNGKAQGVLTLKGATNVDWEAAAWGKCQLPLTGNCVYVGDINRERLSQGVIYFFNEPASPQGSVNVQSLKFYYAKDGKNLKTDAESMFVDPRNGQIILGSKTYDKNKTKQSLFRLSVSQGWAHWFMDIPGVQDEVGDIAVSFDGSLLMASESGSKGQIVFFTWDGKFTRLKYTTDGQPEEAGTFTGPCEVTMSGENESTPAVLHRLTLTGCAGTSPAPTPTPVPPGPTPAPTPAPATGYYVPKPMTSVLILTDNHGAWDKQVAGKPHELIVVEAVPGRDGTCAEGYAKIAAGIAKLHAMGKKVSCYHSLSYESWRCDRESFPASAKGSQMDGYDEIWADWRATSKAHAFWDNRYDQFQKIGCDCVEDDNEVDPEDNDSGFPLTKVQAEAASKRRADYAHSKKLCHLAKNNPTISAEKSRHSDGVMIEQAGKYNERASYLPWKSAGKFGAMIEYNSSGCKAYPGFFVQYHPTGKYFNGKEFADCN